MRLKSLFQKQSENLTEGPLVKQIVLFALPLILSNALQRLFNTADTITVGRWGGETQEACENALAAVGSCGALINLIICMFAGLSLGAGVTFSHALGAKKYEDADTILHTSVTISIICGIISGFVGIVFARPLLVLMGTPEAVLGEAVPYMVAYFVGIPANLMYSYCSAILSANGDTQNPLKFLTVAGVANVGMNLVMVLVFKLGALGVGIATAVSHWVALFLTVGYMMRKKGVCHLDLRRLSIDWEKAKNIIAIGIPSGLQGMVFSFSNVIIQSSVNSLGKVMVAGNSAASNLGNYIYAVQNTFYQAALTFVGQNRGAGNYGRIKGTAIHCTWLTVVIGGTLSVASLIFARPLLGLFAPGNEAVIEAGIERIYYIELFQFVCGIMEVGCGCIRGLGKSTSSMVISLLGSCVTRLIWIYTVFAVFHTPGALFVCYPISWVVTSIAHYTLFTVIYKKEKRAVERIRAERIAER